jgi:hypothetical protein
MSSFFTSPPDGFAFSPEAVPKLQLLEQLPRIFVEKPGFCRFFQELGSKPTGFWNKLTIPGV